MSVQSTLSARQKNSKRIGFLKTADKPNSVSQSTVDIYADDTTLSTSAVVLDLPAIQQRLQRRHKQDCRLDILQQDGA